MSADMFQTQVFFTMMKFDVLYFSLKFVTKIYTRIAHENLLTLFHQVSTYQTSCGKIKITVWLWYQFKSKIQFSKSDTEKKVTLKMITSVLILLYLSTNRHSRLYTTGTSLFGDVSWLFIYTCCSRIFNDHQRI